MKCRKCKREIPLEELLCRQCGEPMLGDDDMIISSDISNDWIAKIMTELGYDVQLSDSNKFLNVTHELKMPAVINVHHQLYIDIMFILDIRRYVVDHERQFFELLNKANSMSRFSIFSNPPYSSLWVMASLFRPQYLSRTLFREFLESSEYYMMRVLSTSGLRDFCWPSE